MPKKDGLTKQHSDHVHFSASAADYDEHDHPEEHHEGRQSLVQSVRSSIRASIKSIQEMTRQGTVFGTVMNVLCNVMGTGILALPLAIHNASVSIGIITICFCSLLGVLAVYILTKAVDYTGTATLAECFANTIYPVIPGHTNLNGDQTAEEEQAAIKRNRARWFVEITIFFLNFGTIVIYGKAIEEAMPPVVIGFLGAAPDSVWANKWFWLGVAAITFYIPTCARQMASLKWTSFIGAVTIFYVAAVVVIKFFLPGGGRAAAEVAASTHMAKMRVSVFESITTFAVAYGFNYNVPPFYDELIVKTPKQMMKTIAISFPIITATYIGAGVCGYMTFGSITADPKYGGNILKMYGNGDIMVGIARLCLFPALALSFPVLAVGLRQTMHRIATNVVKACRAKKGEDAGEEDGLVPSSGTPEKRSAMSQDPLKQPFWVIGLEAAVIVVGSILTAAYVPGIGLVINIVGALFGIWIMMIFPGIIGTYMWCPCRADKEFEGHPVYSHEGLPTYQVPGRRWLRVGSIATLVSGFVCTLVGIFSIVWGLIHKHEDPATAVPGTLVPGVNATLAGFLN